MINRKALKRTYITSFPIISCANPNCCSGSKDVHPKPCSRQQDNHAVLELHKRRLGVLIHNLIDVLTFLEAPLRCYQGTKEAMTTSASSPWKRSTVDNLIWSASDGSLDRSHVLLWSFSNCFRMSISCPLYGVRITMLVFRTPHWTR